MAGVRNRKPKATNKPSSKPKSSSSSSLSSLLLPITLVAVLAGSAFYFRPDIFSGAPSRRSLPDGVEISEQLNHLTRWDPIAVNHTRKLILDDTDRIYEMRTLSLDPPIFEIEDFLTDKEVERIKSLAERQGFAKSDHTYLDGSNLHEKDKKLGDLSYEEADKLFRYSDQTWVDNAAEPTLEALMSRVMRLTKLPEKARSDSEMMQVVKYKHHGHYESHHDSENDDKGPCCIDPDASNFRTGVDALGVPLEQRCRLCRFITVLYYLMDTTEGGGTVFPLADTTEEQLSEWSDWPEYQQTRKCSPGLKVMPKKRKAILWYNHKVDRGYLGPLDIRSLHGGCNVIKGNKFIANHWLSALPHPSKPKEKAKAHI
eukprot:m.19672 g.19672  ORF g.19672 m.19672 type:complete len:371 (+) comp12291_c0_seq1:58-1170(+)